MSPPRPRARLDLGGRALSGPEAALSSLRIELSSGAAHDLAVIRLDAGTPFAGVTAGADAVVEVGYDDDLETVFTGTVASVRSEVGEMTVVAVGSSARASAVRVGRSYVGSSVGDVVTDLLSAAGVDPGEIDADTDVAAYHVDERRPVWRHIGDLARLAGCELTSDGDGRVNVRPPRSTPAVAATLRHGAELVAWSVGSADPAEADLDVVPFGAASEKGAEGWHLLLREPDGGSPDVATLVPPALRDRDSAVALGDALAAARQRRTATGHVVAVGSPALRAGDVVELSDLPGAGSSNLRVTEVEHLLDGHLPFVTRLRVEATA